jgi:hypothetical protein
VGGGGAFLNLCYYLRRYYLTESDVSPAYRSKLSNLAVSLHGFGCASGIVVGFHRSPISLAIAGRMASSFAATSLEWPLNRIVEGVL